MGHIYIYTVKEIDRIVFMVINYPGICSRMLSLFFFLVMELFSRFQNCEGSSSTSSDRRCLSRECISRNISAKCKSLFHLKARYIYKRLKTRGSGKGQIFRKRGKFGRCWKISEDTSRYIKIYLGCGELELIPRVNRFSSRRRGVTNR